MWGFLWLGGKHVGGGRKGSAQDESLRSGERRCCSIRPLPHETRCSLYTEYTCDHIIMIRTFLLATDCMYGRVCVPHVCWPRLRPCPNPGFSALIMRYHHPIITSSLPRSCLRSACHRAFGFSARALSPFLRFCHLTLFSCFPRQKYVFVQL